MSVTIPASNAEFLAHSSLRLARIFEIRPTLAIPLHLTSHGTALLFENRTYQPASAIEASAQSEATGGEDFDTSFSGALSSELITHADLVNGVYRGAKIIERIVDWRYPMAGAIRTYTYYVEDIKFTNEQFEARLGGIQGKLRRARGGFMSRQCGVDLGSFLCGASLNIIPLATIDNVPVVEVISRNQFRMDPTAVPTGLGDEWFQWGKVEWKLGLNRFRFGMVAKYEEATRTVTLAEGTTYPVSLDNGAFGPDLLRISAGCDKTQSHCGGKFNNFRNYQGQPFVRGSDQYFNTPRS